MAAAGGGCVACGGVEEIRREGGKLRRIKSCCVGQIFEGLEIFRGGTSQGRKVAVGTGIVPGGVFAWSAGA